MSQHMPPVPVSLSAMSSTRLQDLANLHAVDPYLIWLLQTGLRQLIVKDKRASYLDFLIQLDQPCSDELLATWGAFARGVPPIYRQPMPGLAGMHSTHISLRLPITDLSLDQIVEQVAQLHELGAVMRLQVGFPRPPFSEPASSPPRPLTAESPQPEPVPHVLIGILEDGCPFGHRALQNDDGVTRVCALWDQSEAVSDTELAGEDPPPGSFGYGRERNADALKGLIQRHQDGEGTLDEESLYEDRAALQRRTLNRTSHAGAVTMLLAGRREHSPSHSYADYSALEGTHPVVEDRFFDDEASRAPIAVVQFPREQINIAGARWLVVRALDGLRYLADQSAKLGGPGNKPVPLVVNVSYGSTVGAHDGSALLETAMSELALAHGCMAVVLAAGNAHGVGRPADAADQLARRPSGRYGHCKKLLPGATTQLRLYIPPNKPIETYLELWFSRASDGGPCTLDAKELSIKAISPGGGRLSVERAPGWEFDRRETLQTCAGLFVLPKAAQSLHRSMAMLVVAATQVSASRVETPSGVWTLCLTNHGSRELSVDAWVERDLLGGVVRTAQAARLLPPRPEEKGDFELSDDNSFNNIATGRNVFRSGALCAHGALGRLAVSAYSSEASSSSSGPEYSAIADESLVCRGIRVCGNLSGVTARMNGSSVATPQAARHIANLLARHQRLDEVLLEISKSPLGDARIGRILI